MTRRVQISRMVHYQFEGRFDLVPIERALLAAQADGTVHQFVAKHYADADVVWFEGRPGKEMRTVLRVVVEARRS